ncbi:MAG TPA: molybdopterin-dependent oxidoreductase [Vicinamibacterales bacterium]|nr:molybdopterin-dependent oxidoreductase [Vicinamibacterales bacterium]
MKSAPSLAPEHIVETACPLDCPDGCSLNVTVQDGRITAIDGSTANPITDGYICAKVRRFTERVYGADRLLYPAVRKGPKGTGARFERVSWHDALSLVAEKMREARDTWGGESILPYSYGGSNGLLTQDTGDATLFRRMGTSRLARTVCAAPTGAANGALYGKMPSVTYPDYPEARLIIVWGVNPSASGIHMVPYLRDAQRRGAKLVVIDPRTTPLAKQADLHLAIKPGTDLPVALAIHRYLFENGFADRAFLDAHTRNADRLREKAMPWTFERAAAEADVPVELVARLADWYATSSPALIRCGWGQERNRNGGNSSLAILALPAVGGKFGVRGGGYAMSNTEAWGIQRTWIGSPEPSTRRVNMNQLGRVLIEGDPPVKVLFVYNSNAAATSPDQRRVLSGLERTDLFTVVFEQVMTDTAHYADVLLPATTFLEGYDIVRAYGPIGLRLARPVIESVGEARSNAEVFSELSRLLELNEATDPSGEIEEMLDVFAKMPAAIGDSLRDHGAAVPLYEGRPVQFVDVMPRTADHIVDLFPEALDREAPAGLYTYRPDPATTEFPLALISPASERTISSTLAELPRPEVRLLMHPSDAAARHLEDGAAVRIFNALGEVRCNLQVGTWIRPGTVSLPKGLWRRHTANGYTANALVPDTLTDLGGGACFNDARVEVEAVVN